MARRQPSGADASTGYVINADSLRVHTIACPAAAYPSGWGEWWFTPWEPGGYAASEYDTPCRRCLPDGLPERNT